MASILVSRMWLCSLVSGTLDSPVTLDVQDALEPKISKVRVAAARLRTCPDVCGCMHPVPYHPTCSTDLNKQSGGDLNKSDLADVQATLDVHWGKHHRTYITNLNGQVEGSDLEGKTLEEVTVASHAALCRCGH